MRLKKIYCFYAFIIGVVSTQAFAQNAIQTFDNTDTTIVFPTEQPLIFTIRQVNITGNKKTRSEIIFREIPFNSGEQYSPQALIDKFELAKQRLMNTALFDEVKVESVNYQEQYVDVSIKVNERWYFYPLPILKPVGRNINDWLFEQNASLDRVNYGIKLSYNNTTGLNDKLRLNFINGYTKQFSVTYERPYIDNNLKWGMKIGFATGKNREINYNTIGDKQVFLKDNDRYIRDFSWFNIGFTYRKAIKTRHQIGFNLFNERVGDTVVALNPSYFKNDRHSVTFPEWYYTFSYFDLDYIRYPTKGYAAEISFYKKGINKYVNSSQLTAHGLASWPIDSKTFFSLRAYGSLKLPFKQPYFNLRFLGYSNAFMQGYEYYVVDGVAGGYIKPMLTRQLFSFKIKLPQGKYNTIEALPIRIFGKIYGNAGYVYNPQPGENYLSNTFLFSGGAGIDILSLSDFTIKLEWTMNRSGQNGLFLH